MKYIAQPDSTFAAIAEDTELFAQLSALPAERRPVFLTEANKEVKAWLAAKDTPPLVTSVTARQAHEALIRKGLADNIRNAIDSIPDPVEKAVADNWFNRSNSFERDNATLKEISTAIGLTSGDVDNLFAYASTL